MSEKPELEVIEEPERDPETEKPIAKSSTAWIMAELKGRGISTNKQWRAIPPEERAKIMQRCKDETGKGSLGLVYKCIKRIAKETPESPSEKGGSEVIFKPSKQVKVDLKEGEEPEDAGGREPPDRGDPDDKDTLIIEPPPKEDKKDKRDKARDYSKIKMWIGKGADLIFNKLAIVANNDEVKLKGEEKRDLEDCWEDVLEEFGEDIDLELLLKYGTIIYAFYVTGMIVTDKIIIVKKGGGGSKPKPPKKATETPPEDLATKDPAEIITETPEEKAQRIAHEQSFPALNLVK